MNHYFFWELCGFDFISSPMFEVHEFGSSTTLRYLSVWSCISIPTVKLSNKFHSVMLNETLNYLYILSIEDIIKSLQMKKQSKTNQPKM